MSAAEPILSKFPRLIELDTEDRASCSQAIPDARRRMPVSDGLASVVSSIIAALTFCLSSLISGTRKGSSIDVHIPVTNCTCSCECPPQETLSRWEPLLLGVGAFLTLLLGLRLGRCSVRTRVYFEAADESAPENKLWVVNTTPSASPTPSSPSSPSAPPLTSEDIAQLARLQVSQVRARATKA